MAFTSFFRDSQTLESLIEQAMPSLCGQCHIRVWDAGCAHGAEPYTLAVMLRERMSELMFRNVKIYATDIDSSFAANVRQGVFPKSELKRIPKNLFQRYFQAAGDPEHCRVVDELRSKIEFSVHDLLSLKPIREGFSLIVCKNVLLHLDERQRCDVLRMFHAAMRKDGMLAMEHTQKMPEELLPLFRQVASNVEVYSRIEIPAVTEHPADLGATRRVDQPKGGLVSHRGLESKVLWGE